MDKGSWWVTVHEAAKSWTQWVTEHTSTCSLVLLYFLIYCWFLLLYFLFQVLFFPALLASSNSFLRFSLCSSILLWVIRSSLNFFFFFFGQVDCLPPLNLVLLELYPSFGTWIGNSLLPHFASVQFSLSVVSDSLQPHELHARPLCPSLALRAYPNSSPLSQWCHPTISSSVIPFLSCPQSFPASGSFQMSQLFAIRWPKYWSFSFNISPCCFYCDVSAKLVMLPNFEEVAFCRR